MNFVIGNESGDFDSVVSAVVYAYFMQKQVRSLTRMYSVIRKLKDFLL